MRLFEPMLPGATGRDRILSCIGALVGIFLAGWIAALAHGDGEALPWIVAPMGASAVLLFAVPASPMAQPWPIVGGNSLSALSGFVVGQALGHGAIACGVGVGLAIGVMSVTRSLHPPGGAAALTGVIGGSLVSDAGWWFPLAPVALDAVVLVAFGWAFHRFLSGHAYPHRKAPVSPTRDPLPTVRVGIRDEDLDAAIAATNETFDIDREDLRTLLSRLELQVLSRRHPDLSCAEIMSRDVISVRRAADPSVARKLLLDTGVRLLPVLDDAERPVGGVGLRELARRGTTVEDVMTRPLIAAPTDPAVTLIPALSDGHRHAAMVVDPDTGAIVGLVTQADLLAALARASENEALAPS